MTGFTNLGAGLRVFVRHLRNTRGKPGRLWWVLRRTLQIVVSGRISGVLQRHAVMGNLYANYQEWIDRYDTLDDSMRAQMRKTSEDFARRPMFSVLIPTYNSDIKVLAAAIESVRRQVYPHWEICIADDASPNTDVREFLQVQTMRDPRIRLALEARDRGIAAATNAALALARGNYVAFLDHDDLLSEAALFRMAAAIEANPTAAYLYSDEDKLDEQDQRHAPHFKPDWNPEWARTTNYVLHLSVIRTDVARAIGGLRHGVDGVQDWDMLLRVVELAGDAGIVHVPHVLYHWRIGAGSTAAGIYLKRDIEVLQRQVLGEMLARRAIPADVESTLGGLRLCYHLPEPRPLVSIVIPTKDHAMLLRQCVESVRTRSTYRRFELVIVDHDSTEPDARAYLSKLAGVDGSRVVPYSGAFNYAAECNLGVAQATGQVVVLLNNDVEVITPGWLEELAGHACQPGTGLVGALLLYPNRTIQHAGVILGVNGSADRPYLGYRRGYAGVAGRALAAQNVTGLITACAAIRRDRYLEVGGMDESLAISHNDLDLCLRLIERGYRNVWTPHAELIHHESVSRGLENSPEQRARANDEALRFRARWGPRANHDPNYNLNLADTGTIFSLAFPPRTQDRRTDNVASVDATVRRAQ